MSEAQKKILMGPGNKMAAPSRQSVRALGGELLEVLKSLGISVYKLSKGERDAFKSAVTGIEQEVVKSLGGKSQKIYDLIQKGKEAFKNK